MKLPRRRFLHFAAGAGGMLALSRVAKAQAYPTRPVRIIVPAAAGGPTDIVARVMSQWLSARLGQQLFVENRTGAGNIVGTEAAVRATADGYTLIAISIAAAVNASLYQKLNYDFIRDIAAVAGIIRTPLAMVVNPSFPVKTVPEFIAYAKLNPGKVNMASGGSGTSPHISGELFKMMTSVNMRHVPYRGDAPALTDLIGGQVQVMFAPVPGSIGYIRAGTLRALAVTTAARSEALPDIATIGDFVPGYEASAWYGIGAPAGTRPEIIDRLNKEINAALTNPQMKARLAELGGTPLLGSPADFGKLIAAETEKWGNVVKFAGLKAD